MALFIAADEPLPIIAWQESEPAFHVQNPSESEQRVRRQFTKTHVYYLGAHTYCSCGFAYGQSPLTDEANQAEEAAGRRSVAALAT